MLPQGFTDRMRSLLTEDEYREFLASYHQKTMPARSGYSHRPLSLFLAYDVPKIRLSRANCFPAAISFHRIFYAFTAERPAHFFRSPSDEINAFPYIFYSVYVPTGKRSLSCIVRRHYDTAHPIFSKVEHHRQRSVHAKHSAIERQLAYNTPAVFDLAYAAS